MMNPWTVVYLKKECSICSVKLINHRYGSFCEQCFYQYHGMEKFAGEGDDSECIGCPKCGVENDAKRWDDYMIKNIILDAIEPPRISIPAHVHERLRTAYYCPSCTEYVQGKDLIRNIFSQK